MGTLYFRKDIKKWNVQIRHRGFKTISMGFENIEDAKKFLEKSEKIMKNRLIKKKEIACLIKLEGEKNVNHQ